MVNCPSLATCCLITATQASLVSLSSATRSSSLLLVSGLKMMEKVTAPVRFAISVLEEESRIFQLK